MYTGSMTNTLPVPRVAGFHRVLRITSALTFPPTPAEIRYQRELEFGFSICMASDVIYAATNDVTDPVTRPMWLPSVHPS